MTARSDDNAMGGNDLTTEFPAIRPAHADDAKGLAACIDAAYAQYSARISDLPPVSEGCAQDIAEHQVWVAVHRDEIVAGVVLVAGAAFMKLANVAVHPDHGGKGLGRRLMERAEREAQQQGFNELRLNTHVDMPENVRLYKHLGWVEVSRSHNTVSMQKRLQKD